jgi:hypothetical protein
VDLCVDLFAILAFVCAKEKLVTRYGGVIQRSIS